MRYRFYISRDGAFSEVNASDALQSGDKLRVTFFRKVKDPVLPPQFGFLPLLGLVNPDGFLTIVLSVALAVLVLRNYFRKPRSISAVETAGRDLSAIDGNLRLDVLMKSVTPPEDAVLHRRGFLKTAAGLATVAVLADAGKTVDAKQDDETTTLRELWGGSGNATFVGLIGQGTFGREIVVLQVGKTVRLYIGTDARLVESDVEIIHMKDQTVVRTEDGGIILMLPRQHPSGVKGTLVRGDRTESVDMLSWSRTQLLFGLPFDGATGSSNPFIIAIGFDSRPSDALKGLPLPAQRAPSVRRYDTIIAWSWGALVAFVGGVVGVLLSEIVVRPDPSDPKSPMLPDNGKILVRTTMAALFSAAVLVGAMIVGIWEGLILAVTGVVLLPVFVFSARRIARHWKFLVVMALVPTLASFALAQPMSNAAPPANPPVVDPEDNAIATRQIQYLLWGFGAALLLAAAALALRARYLAGLGKFEAKKSKPKSAGSAGSSGKPDKRRDDDPHRKEKDADGRWKIGVILAPFLFFPSAGPVKADDVDKFPRNDHEETRRELGPKNLQVVYLFLRSS